MRLRPSSNSGSAPPDPPALRPPDRWIERFATLPLLEQPSSVWRYELAFAVLVVRAAGRSLDVTLADRVFELLGMTRTAFVADPTRLVPAFVRRENELKPFNDVANSRWASPPRFPDGRGGLVSTAGDLLRFAGMLLDSVSGLLTPSSVIAMTSDQLTPEQRAGPSAATFLDSAGWGYGIGVIVSPAGRRYGWDGGLGTLRHSWPEHDLAAVLITQVLPPSAEMFERFTAAVDNGLTC